MRLKVLLSVLLLAGSMLFAVPHAANAECVDGVICPVPWDAYNCAPINVFIDCSVCNVSPEDPLNRIP